METLQGTSFCEQNECPTCISRMTCVIIALTGECRVVADVLGHSAKELFPSLDMLHYLLQEDKD